VTSRQTTSIQAKSHRHCLGPLCQILNPPYTSLQNRTVAAMADLSTCPPLIPSSVRTAYTKIQQHIHRTPLLTSRTLDLVASSPDPAAYLAEDPTAATASSISTPEQDDAPPRLKLFFKAENFQKIGAFKARGAFHALVRLVEELGLEEVRRRGLVTHSSGRFDSIFLLHLSSYPPR